jgi:pimeloyl-ACP methyl ester carboxylesterase
MAMPNNTFPVEKAILPSKAPVIFIHGAGGSALSWPAELRSSRDQRFYFLDLPGHGKSDQPSHQSIPELADAVLAFMDSQKIGRAVVIGHSMGGAIALWLAVHSPKRLLGIGLLSTAANIRVSPEFLLTYDSKASFGRFVQKVIELSFSENISPRVKELAQQRLLLTRPTVLYNDFFACSHFDLASKIEKINLPTLIISGSNDRMISFGHSLQLNKRIKGSQCHILDGIGHMVLLEQPDQVTTLIRNFLEKINYTPGLLTSPN